MGSESYQNRLLANAGLSAWDKADFEMKTKIGVAQAWSGIKLPVTYKRRSCTSDQGCDNIYNGDTVYVEGYNDAFKATIYDTAMQYSIPYY